MPLTKEQVQAYETEGFVPKVQISDETEATQHRELFDELEARLGREECAIGLVDRHFEEPLARIVGRRQFAGAHVDLQ